MGGAVILWVISSIVFFFFLYLVIQSAIDNSTMAQNIQAIRDEIDQKRTQSNQIESEINPFMNDEETSESNDNIEEECPACGEKVNRNTKVCPECGLTLSN